MHMAIEDAGPTQRRACVHRTHFKRSEDARAEARRMSRNLGARIAAFYCTGCDEWYVGASQERALFDKTDLEIIKMLAIGLRDHDMAADLHVNEYVVRKRVSEMFERTETNSRAQLVAYAIFHKMVDYGRLMEGKPSGKR